MSVPVLIWQPQLSSCRWSADLPHGIFAAGKATRLLGWVPRDNLHGYTHRPAPAAAAAAATARL